jgi:hypothetical protein
MYVCNVQTQMQSEKKYKTKAAQEYKKHLAKLLQDSSAAANGTADAAAEAVDTSAPAGGEGGLDNIMKSLSNTDLAGDGGPSTSSGTVFGFAEGTQAAAPAPTPAPTPVVHSPVKPIGTLSIAAVTEPTTASPGTVGKQ